MTRTLLVATFPLSPRGAQLRDALEAAVGEAPDGADITVWASPWTRRDPLPVAGAGVQVLDLHGAIAACPGAGAAAQAAWCVRVAGLCRGASLLLVGSAAEQGFWSAILAEARVASPVAVVPYAPAARPKAAGTALAIAGPWIADPALRPMLEAARSWAEAAGIGVVPGPSLNAAGALEATILLPGAGPAAMLLDLRRDTPAERVATPPHVLDALAAGMPVLTTVDGALGQAIEAAGAGRVLTGRFEPPPAQAGAAAATLPCAPETARTALRAALARATQRDGAARARWTGAPPPARLGRVLVLSDEAQTLAAVRIHQPFGALCRRGALSGYAVLHKGELVFDSHPGSGRGFDAVWAYRSADPRVRLILHLLGRPFAYDIDDNLLASPSYRPRFHPVAMQTTRDLLRRAALVSCGTPRLARLLGARLGSPLAERLLVTPNLADRAPAPRPAGPPRAIVWASSDRPALAGATAAIVRAVRDHAMAHGTPVLCIGAAPPEGLRSPGLPLETLGVLPHAEYRTRLRALSPAVLVCPLETGADADTQDFIDGKSDIKLIEALSDGLVAVASRAAPFLDSDLPGAVLCDNSYDSWLAGLAAAREACLTPEPAPAWPAARDAGGFGLAPWAEALARVRLADPVTPEELRRAVSGAEERAVAAIPAEEFDEADYLANYDDVRDAVAAGMLPSGYAHFAGPGRQEGRYARRRASPEALGEAWWAALLHQLGRLEAAGAARDAELAGFERRLALRRALAGRGA